MATGFIFVFLGMMAIVCFLRPSVVVGLAMVIYPLEQWALANSSFFRMHPTWINLGFGIVTLVGVISVAFRGQNPVTPVTRPLVIWMLLISYAAASCVWSVRPFISYYLLSYHLPYLATFIVLIPMTVRNLDDLHVALLAGLVLGIMTMTLLLTGTTIHDWGRTVALAEQIQTRGGTQEDRLNPLAIADMCGAMVILAVLLNFQKLSHIWAVLRWVIAIFAIALTIRSGSRGQLIGSLMVAVVLLGASRPYARHVQVAAIAIIGGILVGTTVWLFQLFNTSATSRWSVEEMTEEFSGTRLIMCATMLNAWIRSMPHVWLFGLGTSVAYDEAYLGIYPHVVVVEVLTELGLVGLAIYSMFLLLIAWSLRQAWLWAKEDTVERGVVTTLAGLWLFDFILTFKQGSLFTHTSLFLYAMLAGRVYVFLRRSHELKQGRMRAILGHRWITIQRRLRLAPQTP